MEFDTKRIDTVTPMPKLFGKSVVVGRLYLKWCYINYKNI